MVGMPDTVRRRRVPIGPPKELLARLRWFFLAFGLFFVVTYLPQLLLQSDREWPVRWAGGLLLVGMGAWWLRCYRRGHFPAWGLILECATFFACVLIPSDPFKGLGLLYISVNFRSLYGSLRQITVFSLVSTTCFVAASFAAPHLGSVDRTSMLAYVLPGIPPLAVIAHLVAVASSRSVRSAARERLLSRAGLAIAEAGTAEAVRSEALAAVSRILADVPGAFAAFVDAGSRPPDDPQPGSPAEHVMDLPLTVNGQTSAALRILSPQPLPDEVGDALSVIAAQAALALSNAGLTEDLRRRASHDSLTGLANRRTMEERLTAALDVPADLGVAVLMLDLDGFKQVNDTLGHAAGDALLVTVADRLTKRCREHDVVARLGGDEFVVVLPHVHDEQDAIAAGHRMLEAARLPIQIQDHVVTVGASIGFAVSRPGSTPSGLLQEADEAMYEAKRSGKNRVCAAPAPAGRASQALA
jgi:diguanylate cyclase (GGDEF)-like protein